ncbi:MAG: hypothetical protein OXH05_10345 [Acidobacteria bacterium]|nr:hypothetical protein [Acidobacteriota bacterium]
MAAGPSADYRRPREAGSEGESTPGEPGAPPPGEPSRRRFRPWRALRIASGFLLLALGIIGLFLPILQGVLMILAGLAVLGKDLPWSRKITDRLAGFVRRRAENRAARKRGREEAAPGSEAS